MKTCPKCKTEKDLEEFPKASSRKDGHAAWCKVCYATRAKQRYQENPDEKARIVKNRNTIRVTNREQLVAYLKGKSCTDCPNSDWRVLEFDHLDRKNKEHNIGNMMLSFSWANILKEIEKCEVVCANCHRIRTAEQFGTWRSL